MPWICTSAMCSARTKRGDGREDRHVPSVEPRERAPGHAIPSAQEAKRPLADSRHRACDVGADLGGEECELVPGEQVPGETEGHPQDQQQRAGDPGDLARRPVGLHEVDGGQVGEREEDHQVRRPRVDGAQEPSEGHGGHDELHRLEGALRRRPVVQHEEHAGHDLHDEEEEGHAAQVVEDRVAVDGDRLVFGQRAQGADAESAVQPVVEDRSV